MTDSSAPALGIVVSLLLAAGFYVWVSLAFAAVFRKAGVEGWKAWVPVLNSVVVLQLAGFSPWLLLLVFFPILGALALVVVFVMAFYRLSVAFGHGVGMTVVGVLASPVWASIVGWGSARWVGREAEAQMDAAPHRTGGDPAHAPLPPFRAPGQPGGPAAYPPAPGYAAPTAPGYTAPPAPANAGGFAPAAYAPPPVPPVTSAPARAAGAAAGTDRVPGAAAPAAAATARFSSVPPAPAADPADAPVSASPELVPPVSGWTPPPLPGRPVPAAGAEGEASARTGDGGEDAAAADGDEDEPWQGFALESTGMSAEVTGAVAGAPSPRSAVPPAPGVPAYPAAAAGPMWSVQRASAEPADPGEATATREGLTRPPVTRVPTAAPVDDAREPWAPSHSAMSDPEAFPESSAPVSAVAGAPAAGGPRSARASVSAQHTRPEIPEDVLDETIIARRKRTLWSLVPPMGDPIAIGAEVVILGRRPVADPAHPEAQLIAIQDGTVSKTHARLRLRDDRWYITDLDSTNGVLFATVLGTEVEATPGEEVEAGDGFLLGDAEVRLVRSDE